MKKINKYFIFSIIISLIILLLTSKNSFFYLFNDWVDANAFFTVGKSWFNNVIPYKDIFEHKGPLLYLIYGIGYLVSNKTFYGVFILEVINFIILLYFSYKIFNLYFEKKYSIILLPIFSFLLTTSESFVHGGSCEEFCLSFLAVSLYYFLSYLNKKELTNKEIFINGLMAGFVLVMKFTILGFWIGFCLLILINYLKNKEYKKVVIFCLLFLLGMLIPFVIFSIYFILIGGFKEFINVYFIFNLFSYSNVLKISIIQKIFKTLLFFIFQLLIGREIFWLIIFNLLKSKIKALNKKTLFNYIVLIGITYCFSFLGLMAFPYYHLPIIYLIIILFLIYFGNYFKKYQIYRFDKKHIHKYLTIFTVMILLLSYVFANYRDDLTKSEKDWVQYKYAKYINKYDNPTLLNMGSLDIGVYTLTGIIPNTRFFQVHNISYDKFKDNLDEIRKYVENKQVKFIVYTSNEEFVPPDYVFENYEIVYYDNYNFEKNLFSSYLLKLKNF